MFNDFQQLVKHRIPSSKIILCNVWNGDVRHQHPVDGMRIFVKLDCRYGKIQSGNSKAGTYGFSIFQSPLCRGLQ